ncbi:MAG: VWA domain-containing protein [Gammaproteobacteria bacterium]|nr:VWA domain-containing protein [Gammaproteobacteria bacterium]MDH4315633.1 VWA domain-containing protein [Gammaproteobacteria bacterium]MDH5215500.1 VWA domain-containing protein [Gammaproteobacteria bacterium]
MKRRRNVEAFSLSFLDCICCGFGAIILLLVLSKIYEPVILEKTEDDLQQLIAKLQEELFDIRGETTLVTRALSAVRLETSETKMTLSQLQKELEKVQGQYELTQEDNPNLAVDEGELRAARQRLTEEMQRLQVYDRAPNDAIGGIPVDSEYVIFVIDTSGSMQSKWSWVEQKLGEVLDVYPRVKGLQIMNDNGRFMFQQYGSSWIDDTPQVRQAIKNNFRQWAPFSDSDPSDGIIYAIKTFWSPDRKISIYVLGDEFQGNSMEAVIRSIDGINLEDKDGNRRVRIHAVGFPYSFDGGSIPTSSQRFAGLMRVICERNGGTFVALTERDH